MSVTSNIQKQGDIREQYTDGVAMQPNRTLVYKDDGSIEGTVTFECDKDDQDNLPALGSLHPDDDRCEMYAQNVTYLPLKRVKLVGSFLGLSISGGAGSKTDPVFQVAAATDRLDITLHPDFESFAGTPDTPLNGAVFDPDTDEFQGFFDPTNDLFGASAFFNPSYMVTRSYWLRDDPNPDKLLTIRSNLPGLKKPSNVKELMLIGTPYRKVGNHVQVSEQWLGSGAGGWNRTLYPQ
jgi:hypothetical protein